MSSLSSLSGEEEIGYRYHGLVKAWLALSSQAGDIKADCAKYRQVVLGAVYS